MLTCKLCKECTEKLEKKLNCSNPKTEYVIMTKKELRTEIKRVILEQAEAFENAERILETQETLPHMSNSRN